MGLMTFLSLATWLTSALLDGPIWLTIGALIAFFVFLVLWIWLPGGRTGGGRGGYSGGSSSDSSSFFPFFSGDYGGGGDCGDGGGGGGDCGGGDGGGGD